MSRMNRTTYFMSLAFLTAQRGTCPRLKTGCILVENRRIVATGYNSSHRATPHCDETGCLMHEGHCIRCLHAEVSAVLNVGSRSNSELTAYVTHIPCAHCYKILTAAGVKHILYKIHYPVESKAYETLRKTIGVPMTEIKEHSTFYV